MSQTIIGRRRRLARRGVQLAIGLGALTFQSTALAAPLTCSQEGLKQYFESQANAAGTSRDDYAVVDTAKLEGDVCIVRGRVRPRQNIRFELRLPSAPRWNGRFFFHGGAGTDGFLPGAVGNKLGGAGRAIDDGYAVVSTDAGHDSLGNWFQLATEPYSTTSTFGRDPELRTDYGYRAVELVTKTAKTFVTRYYDDAIDKSFFVGCSNGGRQAIMAAKRLPDEFDGILAGAPAINIAKQIFQAVQDVQELSKLSDWPGAAISPAKMRYVADKIVAACDHLDGVADKMVGNTVACQAEFDPQTLKRSWLNPFGLLAREVDALTTIMGGAKYHEQQIYASWLWDPGIAANMSGASWRSWRMESAFGLVGGAPYPIMVFIGGGALANLISSPPVAVQDAPGTAREMWNYLKAYDIESGYPKLFSSDDPRFAPAHDVLDVPSPHQLGSFESSSGRLIVFSGSSDGTVSTNDVTRWYDDLLAEDSRNGRPTADHARLYVVPGMAHCGGGPGTDSFDLFSVLEDWADGAAPSDSVPPRALVGAGNLDAIKDWRGKRSRPLCSYPRVAVYQGGDVESADSFDCETP